MRRYGRTNLPGTRLVLALGFLVPSSAAAQAASPRVDSLVRAMTLEEKVTFLRGERDPAELGQAGYIPGLPRLGIPPLRLTDGPAGVRTARPATAFPAPVALAASFDPDLAYRYGKAIGRDGLARNQDVLLAPMVNIVRVPQAGRNFETLGEDPHLASRLVAEEVRGIQDAGLIATVKHYVANSFENARTSVSAEIGEQALHEIYLPGFEAAVRAGAGSVMCAYNQVNGAFACDDAEILDRVLRGAWGFDGWVMTDWGARHSAGALEAGLDQEMPGGRGSSRQPVYFGDSLVASVRAGRTPEALVDRAVRRILVQMERFGLLDGSSSVRPRLDSLGGAAVAREAALEGAVLLRNEGGLLPLDLSSPGSVVVIGPTAVQHLVGGGGSSHVLPLSADATLPALRRRAGAGVEIRYRPGIDLEGVPVPSSALGHEDAGGEASGLARGRDDAADGADPTLDLTGARALPRGHTWRWTGTLTAPTTGDYDLAVQSNSSRVSVTLDGARAAFRNSLINTADGLRNTSLSLRLEAGVRHAVEIDAADVRAGTEGDLEVRLAWVTPERRRAVMDSAVAAARAAREAVVFAYNEGTEGVDRTSLSLPGVQDALVAAVARANPRTVVVLQTGDPVTMPWIDDVGAVLETWYPGEVGGEATTALLLGEATPGGKLPVSFPRWEEAMPTADSARYPGVDGRAVYGEGIFVGYRWYDAEGVEPLFPFGHGLSYTTFAYEGLDVRARDDGLDVSFVVRNTGERAGVEVAQVYLGPAPSPPAPMATKSLAGFARLVLTPGERRQVLVHVDGRALSYWSEAEHTWRRAPGTRAVLVGSSSRDIRLTGRVEVAPRR